MSTNAAMLAARFASLNDEVVAAVAGCSDTGWRRPTEAEGWPVAVAAHHIAATHRDFVGLLQAFVAGGTVSPSSSMDDVDESNARHAREYASVERDEVLALLQSNGDAVLSVLRSLSDDQLAGVAGVFGGRELSVAQVAEWIVIGHAAEHFESIRATLEQEGTGDNGE